MNFVAKADLENVTLGPKGTKGTNRIRNWMDSALMFCDVLAALFLWFGLILHNLARLQPGIPARFEELWEKKANPNTFDMKVLHRFRWAHAVNKWIFTWRFGEVRTIRWRTKWPSGGCKTYARLSWRHVYTIVINHETWERLQRVTFGNLHLHGKPCFPEILSSTNSEWPKGPPTLESCAPCRSERLFHKIKMSKRHAARRASNAKHLQRLHVKTILILSLKCSLLGYRYPMKEPHSRLLNSS